MEDRISNVKFGANEEDKAKYTEIALKKANEIKDKVDIFLAQYSIYDILGFLFVMILGLLFVILAISLRRRIGAMLLLLLLSIATFAGGPYIMHLLVNSVVRKTTIQNLEVKQLVYTRAMVVSGQLHNDGKIDLKNCSVKIEIWKKAKNDFVKYMRYVQKPKKHQAFHITDTLTLKEDKDFRIVYDDFRLVETDEVVVKSHCE